MSAARTTARRAGPNRRRPRDAGMVTAELAVSLPALALLLAVGLGALAVVRDQIECVDAANQLALAYARGDSPPPISGVGVEVGGDGDVVRVVVRRHRDLLGGLLPGIDISATAVAAVEPHE